MVSEPKLLRVTRPYHSVDEYLEQDGWTLAARSIILVGTEPIPVGTVLRCDIVLATGRAVLRFEGAIEEHVERHQGRPGGVRVRFRRMARSSQQLVKRVLSQRRELNQRTSSSPLPADSVPPSLVPESLIPEPVESIVPPPSSASFQSPAMPPAELGRLKPAPTPAKKPSTEVLVSAPVDREALLERLRARSSRLAKASDRDRNPTDKTG